MLRTLQAATGAPPSDGNERGGAPDNFWNAILVLLEQFGGPAQLDPKVIQKTRFSTQDQSNQLNFVRFRRVSVIFIFLLNLR